MVILNCRCGRWDARFGDVEQDETKADQETPEPSWETRPDYPESAKTLGRVISRRGSTVVELLYDVPACVTARFDYSVVGGQTLSLNVIFAITDPK